MFRIVSNPVRTGLTIHRGFAGTVTPKSYGPRPSATSADYTPGSQTDRNSKEYENQFTNKKTDNVINKREFKATTSKDNRVNFSEQPKQPGVVDRAVGAMYAAKASVKETLGFDAKEDRMAAEEWRGERTSTDSTEWVGDSEVMESKGGYFSGVERERTSLERNQTNRVNNFQSPNRFGPSTSESSRDYSSKSKTGDTSTGLDQSTKSSEGKKAKVSGTSVSSATSSTFMDDTTRLDQVGHEPWRNEETVEMQGMMKNTYDWKSDPKRSQAKTENQVSSKQSGRDGEMKTQSNSRASDFGTKSSDRTSTFDKRTERSKSFDDERSQYQSKSSSSSAFNKPSQSTDDKTFKQKDKVTSRDETPNVKADKSGNRLPYGTRQAETDPSAKVSSRDSSVPKAGMMGKPSRGTDSEETNISAKDRSKAEH